VCLIIFFLFEEDFIVSLQNKLPPVSFLRCFTAVSCTGLVWWSHETVTRRQKWERQFASHQRLLSKYVSAIAGHQIEVRKWVTDSRKWVWSFQEKICSGKLERNLNHKIYPCTLTIFVSSNNVDVDGYGNVFPQRLLGFFQLAWNVKKGNVVKGPIPS